MRPRPQLQSTLVPPSPCSHRCVYVCGCVHMPVRVVARNTSAVYKVYKNVWWLVV